MTAVSTSTPQDEHALIAAVVPPQPGQPRKRNPPGVRYVRTQQGAEVYGVPIGSQIKAGQRPGRIQRPAPTTEQPSRVPLKPREPREVKAVIRPRPAVPAATPPRREQSDAKPAQRRQRQSQRARERARERESSTSSDRGSTDELDGMRRSMAKIPASKRRAAADQAAKDVVARLASFIRAHRDEAKADETKKTAKKDTKKKAPEKRQTAAEKAESAKKRAENKTKREREKKTVHSLEESTRRFLEKVTTSPGGLRDFAEHMDFPDPFNETAGFLKAVMAYMKYWLLKHGSTVTAAGARYVRTPEGAQHFRQPIGSMITKDRVPGPVREVAGLLQDLPTAERARIARDLADVTVAHIAASLPGDVVADPVDAAEERLHQAAARHPKISRAADKIREWWDELANSSGPGVGGFVQSFGLANPFSSPGEFLAQMATLLMHWLAPVARALGLTSAGESWRWQLRDRLGKWIEMGAEVKWLARGRWKYGMVEGSPAPGVAAVRDYETGRQELVASSRLEVVQAAEDMLKAIEAQRVAKGRVDWKVLDLTPEKTRGEVLAPPTEEISWQDLKIGDRFRRGDQVYEVTAIGRGTGLDDSGNLVPQAQAWSINSVDGDRTTRVVYQVDVENEKISRAPAVRGREIDEIPLSKVQPGDLLLSQSGNYIRVSGVRDGNRIYGVWVNPSTGTVKFDSVLMGSRSTVGKVTALDVPPSTYDQDIAAARATLQQTLDKYPDDVYGALADAAVPVAGSTATDYTAPQVQAIRADIQNVGAGFREAVDREVLHRFLSGEGAPTLLPPAVRPERIPTLDDPAYKKYLKADTAALVNWADQVNAVRRDLARDVVGTMQFKALSTKQDWENQKAFRHQRFLRPAEKQRFTDSLLLFPRSWVNRFDFTHYTTNKVSRGYHSWDGTHIGISDYAKDGPVDGGQMATTMVHEIAHGMEPKIPGLRIAEGAFWAHRTGLNPVLDASTMKMEDGGVYAKTPKRPTPVRYSLKAYMNPDNTPRAFEVLSTGIQEVLGSGKREMTVSVDGTDTELWDFSMGALLTFNNFGIPEPLGDTAPVVAAVDRKPGGSWQLRDSKGQWVEMGARVMWFDKGLPRIGIVNDSPEPGKAKVRDVYNGELITVDADRLTVKSSPPEAPKAVTPRDAEHKALRVGDQVWWNNSLGEPQIGVIQDMNETNTVATVKPIGGDDYDIYALRTDQLHLGLPEPKPQPASPTAAEKKEIARLKKIAAKAKREGTPLNEWSSTGEISPDEWDDLVKRWNSGDIASQIQARNELLVRLTDLGFTATEAERYLQALHDRDIGIKNSDRYWSQQRPEVRDRMLNLFKHLRGVGTPTIAAPAEAAEAILREGRFKTQFETGSSMGMNDPDTRAKAELVMLGLRESIPDKERPIYGFLSTPPDDATFNPSDASTQYGAVQFHLKPRVKDRATMTWGDSLGGQAVPIPLVGDVTDQQLLRAVAQWSRDPGPMIRGGDYGEVQIRGGVTLDDVERITIFPDMEWDLSETGDHRAQLIEDLASQHGIPVEVLAGDAGWR